MEMLFDTLLVVTAIAVMGALVAYLDDMTDYCIKKGWM